MSDQHKRKRDDTATEANKKMRPADGGIVIRMEDMSANWLQAPVTKKTGDARTAAKKWDDRPYALYRTAFVTLNLDELIQTRLSKGRHGSVPVWRAMAHTAQRVSDIYAFHIQQNDVNQQFIAIADDQDFARRGLNFINLNYKGSPDAIRQKAHAVGDFVGRELLGYDHNEHALAWCNHVIEKASSTLYPLRSFAIFVKKYCTDPIFISSALESALMSDNHAGWNGRHREFPSVLAQWEMLTTSDWRQHEQWRVEKDWNEHYYVVVGDGIMDDAEVEIVGAQSQKRWKWSFSNFCDILHYLTIGLITEDELSLPWKSQPELLRTLSPEWLQGFQDDIAAARDMDDSDKGDDCGDSAEFEMLKRSMHQTCTVPRMGLRNLFMVLVLWCNRLYDLSYALSSLAVASLPFKTNLPPGLLPSIVHFTLPERRHLRLNVDSRHLHAVVRAAQMATANDHDGRRIIGHDHQCACVGRSGRCLENGPGTTT